MTRFTVLFTIIFSLQAWSAEPRVITLECDDLLRFSLAEMKASPGEVLSLELTNTGRISRMKHNFVLLKPGANLARFGSAAVKAEATHYIPESMKDQVIAHTTVAGPGETVRVAFTAPEKGQYAFICSFPGHQSISKGKFIVE